MRRLSTNDSREERELVHNKISEKQTNSNIVTGERKKEKRSSLHLPMSHCIPVSGGNSAKTQSDICFASRSSPSTSRECEGSGRLCVGRRCATDE
ncbi:hypothetical protein QQF64_001843 [Cirrhinus molitorella]|uniref:Uncharacterized protein n=1 Tax=Cirrhinus molitorella TaxID=172907 RepID=A0ABR3MNH1_9TELE